MTGMFVAACTTSLVNSFMSKIIIGLTGQIASGKGETKRYLNDKYNAAEHRFSTMLRDALKRFHLEINRENMQKISTVLRQNFGEDLMAKVIAEDIREDNSPIIVIDGVRRLTDITYLREMPNFFLIAINTDQKIRYERLKIRKENPGDENKSFEDFLHEERAEAELEIPVVMETANFQIDNNKDFAYLHEQIDKFISEVQNKKLD